jgi:hypothetical protein
MRPFDPLATQTSEGGPLGLSCTSLGLSLAGVPLLLKTGSKFTPRPRNELAELIRCAQLQKIDLRTLMSGLGVAANALNRGDLGRAMIAGAQLGLPRLSWVQATRIANAELRLANYSDAETRNQIGRWATASGLNSTAHPPPSKRQASPVIFPRLTPLRLAGIEEIAGGGPEDPLADVAAAVTLAAGFLLSQIAANRDSQTTTGAGNGRHGSSQSQASPRDPDENECEELLNKDMINCQIVKATRGSRKAFQCRSVAMERYSECLRGGLSNVRTPPYWGN